MHNYSGIQWLTMARSIGISAVYSRLWRFLAVLVLVVVLTQATGTSVKAGTSELTVSQIEEKLQVNKGSREMLVYK